mgnify:CR=1 FL=1
MIEVENITKYYGSTLAVDDVSFRVNEGEVVGFLGPNGAGKTTAMRVMLGLLIPDRGTVRLNGTDLWQDSVGLRRNIGYLPENTPLYDELSVVDLLRFVGSMRGIRGKALNKRVDELVDICSLSEMAYKDVGELSRGYRQRVGLALAIIHDPPCLVLDEPTTGLDPTQIVEIRKLIREFGTKKAILFSTHILDEAQKTSDRILVISRGKIVAEGTPETLTRLARGQNFYEVEFFGEKSALLEKLQGALELGEEENLPDGWVRMVLVGRTQEDLSEKVFSAVVSSGGKLRKLIPRVATLEEVFLELTRGEFATRSPSPASGSGASTKVKA